MASGHGGSMKQLKHVIERRQGNGTITLDIRKGTTTAGAIYNIDIVEENYSSSSSMYSKRDFSMTLRQEELRDFQAGIGKALLFLGSK